MPEPPPVTTTPEPGEAAPPECVRRRTGRGARREAPVPAPSDLGVLVRERGEVRGRRVVPGDAGLFGLAGAIGGLSFVCS